MRCRHPARNSANLVLPLAGVQVLEAARYHLFPQLAVVEFLCI